ncbi:MAG: c-type cytochrome domain-containing protein [Pirellulales bacterium]|nr:c-type cytochrome domain-containing protein [Pirellulales bacterium]
MPPRVVLLLLLGLLGLLYQQSGLIAAITPEQKKKVEAAATALGKVEAQLKAGKYDAAAKLLPAAQDALLEFAAQPEMALPVGNLAKRLDAARGELELQGVTIPPFTLPMVEKPAPGTPGKGGGTISFVKQIAPFLVAKCGNCHVNNARGGLNFASYEVIEKGSQGKLLLQKGDSKNSEGVREIESGNMPRGGLKVEPAELAAFKKWIDEGAKFDGPDPKALLTSLVPRGNTPPPMPLAMPMLDVVAATGKETVSFSRDIAPILTSTCFDCHGEGQGADRGGLRFNHFRNLLKGGDSGAIVVPGKPGDSLLIKKLKGTAGERMPLNRDPLADTQIALVEKWITEGASFDGGDAMLNLETVVATVKAKSATHDQLKADRRQQAERYFRTAVPDEQPKIFETHNVLVIGNCSEDVHKQIGEAADAQLRALAVQYKIPSDQPPVKGRITLFALRENFYYREWKLVEDREIPIGLHGHIRYDVINAYGVIWPPAKSSDFSLKLLAQEQASGLFIGNLGMGQFPSWFATGAGKVLAAKLEPRDPRIKYFDNNIAAALGGTRNVGQLLSNNVAGEANDILAYGFVKSVFMGKNTNFNNLLAAVRGGANFEAAVRKIYGGTVPQLLSQWSGRR